VDSSLHGSASTIAIRDFAGDQSGIRGDLLGRGGTLFKYVLDGAGRVPPTIKFRVIIRGCTRGWKKGHKNIEASHQGDVQLSMCRLAIRASLSVPLAPVANLDTHQKVTAGSSRTSGKLIRPRSFHATGSMESRKFAFCLLASSVLSDNPAL